MKNCFIFLVYGAVFPHYISISIVSPRHTKRTYTYIYTSLQKPSKPKLNLRNNLHILLRVITPLVCLVQDIHCFTVTIVLTKI